MVFPAVNEPVLPNDVYSATSTGGLARRSFTGSVAGPSSNVAVSGLNWTSVRGAFMVNGFVYLAMSDGSFVRRSFDGATLGAAEPVNGQDALVVLTAWRTEASTATGMFYDNGRVYYTLSGANALYYRYLNLESGIVGAVRYQASANLTGINFSQVRGMFLAGQKLYWAVANGTLNRIDWVNRPASGAPVAGTAVAVSGPAVDGITWDPRATFLFQDAAGEGIAQPPVAEFAVDCTSLACAFDASASTAPASTISSYAWDFGDGSTGTGRTPDHDYAVGGDYDVTLTVTTARSLTDTETKPVQVVRVNAGPVADFTRDCSELTCVFDASGSSDPDGTLTGYDWDFGDGDTASGATPAAHTFPGAGSYEVALTVTDNEGATDVRTVTVEVSPAAVAFVAAASANGNRTTHAVEVPSSVQAGDRLVLFLTVNSTAVTITPPSGWTAERSTDGSSFAGRVWTRVADGSDAGTSVEVGLSGSAKGDITVAAYRSNTGSVSVAESAEVMASSATAITPAAVPVGDGGIGVVYVGAKAGSAITADLPGALTGRTSSTGSGSGAIFAWAADSGGYLSGGSFGGESVNLSGQASRVLAYTLLLRAEVEVNAGPVADFTWGCSELTCVFDASGSSDPDGSLTGYDWDFGDGDTASGATPAAHTFPGVGGYEVALTVTDNEGATDVRTVTVEVSPAAVAFVAAASANGNRTTHAVEVPSSVQAGDRCGPVPHP